MLSSQGPAQDPNLIPVLIALAIVLIVWWRIVLIIIAIGLVIVLGLGVAGLFHDVYHAVGG